MKLRVISFSLSFLASLFSYSAHGQNAASEIWAKKVAFVSSGRDSVSRHVVSAEGFVAVAGRTRAIRDTNSTNRVAARFSPDGTQLWSRVTSSTGLHDDKPPHSSTPVPVLTVSGAAGAKAIAWQSSRLVPSARHVPTQTNFVCGLMFQAHASTNAAVTITDNEANVPSFRLQLVLPPSNLFRLTLTSPATRLYNISVASELNSWTPWAMLVNTNGTARIIESMGTNTNRLCFRARLQ